MFHVTVFRLNNTALGRMLGFRFDTMIFSLKKKSWRTCTDSSFVKKILAPAYILVVTP